MLLLDCVHKYLYTWICSFHVCLVGVENQNTCCNIVLDSCMYVHRTSVYISILHYCRKQCRKATEITQEQPVEEVKLDATSEQDISDRNKETTI